MKLKPLLPYQSSSKPVSPVDVEKMQLWSRSPLAFIEDVWGLVPQEVLPEFAGLIADCELGQVSEEWFAEFQKGKNLTWQQYLIVLSVERAVQGKGNRFISVASGHGIGKTAALSMLILWYLATHLDAQVPCTAPTSTQMHDILWKEVAVWMKKMPGWLQKKFDWTNTYLRVTESPDTWFARARTAAKENPEALAGVHGEYVMFVVDEASGVPEEIFETAQGAFTGPNVLFIMISNHTRLEGRFHDSQTAKSSGYQTLTFDSRESPIVDLSYVKGIIDDYGADSNQFRVRVRGLAPVSASVDERGYTQLFSDDDIQSAQVHVEPFGEKRLGVDVAEAGDNFSAFVFRQANLARVHSKFQSSDTMVVTGKVCEYVRDLEVVDRNVFVDNLGVGKGVYDRLVEQSYQVNGVRASETADDSYQFANRRAQNAWRARQWIKSGGCLEPNVDWRQLLQIKYKVDSSGRIQLMTKDEMRKAGIQSPDVADSFFMTFDRPDSKVVSKSSEDRRAERELLKQFDANQRDQGKMRTGSAYLRRKYR